MRSQAGEDLGNSEGNESYAENNIIEDQKFGGTKSVYSNDNWSPVNKGLTIKEVSECTNKLEALKLQNKI